jgi:hypothetical protein
MFLMKLISFSASVFLEQFLRADASGVLCDKARRQESKQLAFNVYHRLTKAAISSQPIVWNWVSVTSANSTTLSSPYSPWWEG